MSLVNGSIVKGCEILERLDQGGMGTVYRARQLSLGREVVVKVLHRDLVADEEHVKRFYREATAAARINHPRIVGVHDTGDHEGEHVIVMEYVPGTSVERLIAEHGCLGVRRALELVADTAEGLAAAHERGIIHRDIKPGNLLVTPEGRVKLTDFGIAKILGADLTRLTQTNVMVGTLQYASPEQFGDAPIDARADIYALGITLYHMLAGARPFGSRNTLVLIQQQLEEVPEPVHLKNGLVPREVSALVSRMIEKRPDDRFADAEELLVHVRTLQSKLGYTDEGVASPSEQPATVGGPWALLSSPAGLITLGAIAGLIGWWISSAVAG